MRFLITGSTGFAGTHLARLLLKEGHGIWGMYCRDLTQVEKVKDVEYICANISIDCDVYNLLALNKFDGIFHLAAKTHPPTSFNEPVDYFETNAMGTIYICEAIRKYQPDTVLMNCSTCEVYGINPEDVKIDENVSIKPQNPYAVSKAAADMYCTERFKNGFLKGFTTRAFSHTGPGRPSNYSISSDAIQIAKIIKGLQEPVIKVGNLKSKRIVMDVRDVVDVYYRLMMKHMSYKNNTLNGEVYNIAGDDLHDMGFFLDKMLELFDVKAEKVIDDKLFRKIDIPVQNPDSTKVREFLGGWEPSFSIESTMRSLVEYWLGEI